jgi:phage/plasmid-like protein (TIGR03299 family)
MAHNIMDDEKFYSYRVPAWHKLGTVSEDKHDANAVYSTLNAPIIIEAPVYGRLLDNEIPIDTHKVICGVVGDTISQYSVVSANYNVVDHESIVKLFDEITKSHVETMGLLGKGETLFLTTVLPEFEVQKDIIKPYLFIINPLTGKDAIQARFVDVRVVCQNTSMIALNEQTDWAISCNHLHNPYEQLKEWLQAVWHQRVEATEFLKEAYEFLATKSINEKQVQDVLYKVYPIKQNPMAYDTPEYEQWEQAMTKQVRHITEVKELFNSSNSRTQATDGTCYGLYNSVTEYEDHIKGYARAKSIMFGPAMKRKQLAFNELVAV